MFLLSIACVIIYLKLFTIGEIGRVCISLIRDVCTKRKDTSNGAVCHWDWVLKGILA